MEAITQQLMDALASYKNTDHGSNRYNTPWRPNADGGTLSVERDTAYGLGLKWYDHKDGTAGNGFTLAKLMGIHVNGRKPTEDAPYASLADYAHAHGLTLEIMQKAGWSETNRAGHLVFAFTTTSGIRYRYADPARAKRKYDSEKGFTNCWYGLERAVKFAKERKSPLILCNGEASTVAAQHHRVPACCITGGEKGVMHPSHLAQLKAIWDGPILVAYDCDTTGRKAGRGLARFLVESGMQARAIDLRGSDGYDLADFCRLHNGTSAERVFDLPPLLDPSPDIHRVDPATGEILEGPIPTDWLANGTTLATLQHQKFAPLRWIIANILPEGACLIAAKPKAKKSWLALGLGLAVAMNGKALGKLDVDPGDVLYLDLEGNQRRIQSRVRAILGNNTTTWPSNFHVFTSWPKGDAGVARLRWWLENHRSTKLIVIDLLAEFRPPMDPRTDRYQYDRETLVTLNRLAEEFHVAIVVIHHTRKAKGDDVFDEVSGTLGINGAVATLWIISRTPDGHVVLSLIGRDLTKDDDPIALSWDTNLCTFVIEGNAHDIATTAERKEVLDLLSDDRPWTPRQIAADLSKSVSAVQALLRDMLQSGLVDKSGYGKYVRIVQPTRFYGQSSQSSQSGDGGASSQTVQEMANRFRGLRANSDSEGGNSDSTLTLGSDLDMASGRVKPTNSDYSDHYGPDQQNEPPEKFESAAPFFVRRNQERDLWEVISTEGDGLHVISEHPTEAKANEAYDQYWDAMFGGE